MSFTCVHCTLRALVKNEPPSLFTETVEEHMERVHPDALALVAERDELEQALAAHLARQTGSGEAG